MRVIVSLVMDRLSWLLNLVSVMSKVFTINTELSQYFSPLFVPS